MTGYVAEAEALGRKRGCLLEPEGGYAMRRFLRPSPLKFLLIAWLVVSLVDSPAWAVAPVKLQNWRGTIDFSDEGTTPFTLEGTASHLGRFTASGEVTFLSGDEEGSFVGTGVVAFEAANGDRLVGVVLWDVAPAADGNSQASLHFSWRDSVKFSDGTVATSTGRFAKADGRPPGLVVIAIIAILIGLLLPAVQK